LAQRPGGGRSTAGTRFLRGLGRFFDVRNHVRGKLAATFYHPKKGAVRYALLAELVDTMGKFEFFDYRKKGVEPSKIPLAVRREVIQWVYDQPDDAIFKSAGSSPPGRPCYWGRSSSSAPASPSTGYIRPLFGS
jgi:hypothetical protein